MGLTWQAASLGHSRNKQIASLWLSPAVRRRFRDRVEIDARGEPFRTVGIPTIKADLVDYLRGRAPLAKATLDAAFDPVVRGYLANEDVVRLHQLRQGWPEYEIIRLVDAATLQGVLLVAAVPGQMPVIYNLEGSASGRDAVLYRIDASDVQAFLQSSAFRLEVRAP
jgi:hypothetical protein